MPASIPIPQCWAQTVEENNSICKVLFDYTRKMGAGIYEQREFLPWLLRLAIIVNAGWNSVPQLTAE